MCPVTFDNSTPATATAPNPAAAPAPTPMRAVPPQPTTAAAEIANLDAALAHLKTSSNATASGTIVFESIEKFEKAIAGLKSVVR